jgi:3-oxoacyl-[acyl-carrier protein] reductase
MRALVTGASRGIGLAIAQKLQEDGLEVVRVDIGGDAEERCDISDEAQVAALATRVGPVEVLVNNAGLWRYGNLLNTPTADLERVIKVNLLGTLYCTRSFGAAMVERGRGSIVNVVSISALAPSPSVGTYSSSKAGIVALTRQTALDWGPHGLRCNAVGPGMIVTEATSDAYADAQVMEGRARAVPLRRLGTPRDIAEVVAFLSSERAGYVSGQVIYVDGGLTQALFELLPYPARAD